jgi:hypothetical protein
VRAASCVAHAVVALAMMTEPTKSALRRYLTFVIVLAFHLAAVVALMRFSRPLPLSTPTALELILIPTLATPKNGPPSILPDSSRVETKIVPTTPNAVGIPWPAASNERPEAPIDWIEEAHRAAAAASTPSAEIRSFDRRFSSDSGRLPKSIFDEPSEHRAGEQFRADDGRWVVYVGDDCYQIADPFASVNASANGMAVQIYCKHKSKTSRADLFDQLPVFQRNHPNP